MNARRGRGAWVAFALWPLAGVLAACSTPAGPPPIASGSPCAACGMAIDDTRFACERQLGGRWRAYDSIECLMRDATVARASYRAPAGTARIGPTYLSDYDGRTLHAADSLWVVKGGFPSPMGGGYAAFIDRAAADEVTAKTDGKVARLAEFEAARRKDAR